MPFINKSESTKRSRDRKENGKCTNATNRRSRVGLSTSFCIKIIKPVRKKHKQTFPVQTSIKNKKKAGAAVVRTITSIVDTNRDVYFYRVLHVTEVDVPQRYCAPLPFKCTAIDSWCRLIFLISFFFSLFLKIQKLMLCVYIISLAICAFTIP